ncbi:TPA: DedA family protein, partial [Pseudomonas aeruginosa]|nr:DedA family protein [Pseudomonas aeruginosa]
FYGLLENFEQVAERYNELGWLMVLLGGGFTPLPYKVITITSGVTQLDLWLFVGLSLVARSLRFAATCALLFWAGPRLKTLIERRLGMAFVLMAVMVVGGLMLGKYVL